MPKTYILEPTEFEFSSDSTWGLTASMQTTPLYGITNDELINLIPNGTIIDINNGDKFITVIYENGVFGTRDGTMSDSLPEEFAGFIVVGGDPLVLDSLAVTSKITTEPGTYTVSIYTGEDDPAPTKNFDFSDHPRNDIEGIDDLLDDILGLKESEKEETSANKPDIGGEPK